MTVKECGTSDPRRETELAQRDEYDYVVVGAGSAGCTLAARLTEDAGVSALLLEAGGWDRDPWIHIPLGWPRQLVNSMYDWMYMTEPEPHLGGRSIVCLRGKVIGGSSSINAMAYSRKVTGTSGVVVRGCPGLEVLVAGDQELLHLGGRRVHDICVNAGNEVITEQSGQHGHGILADCR